MCQSEAVRETGGFREFCDIISLKKVKGYFSIKILSATLYAANKNSAYSVLQNLGDICSYKERVKCRLFFFFLTTLKQDYEQKT